MCLLYQLMVYGLCTLPDTDLDPDPGRDIRPKNGYSNYQGSGPGLESEPDSVHIMVTVSEQYNVAIRFGV